MRLLLGVSKFHGLTKPTTKAISFTATNSEIIAFTNTDAHKSVTTTRQLFYAIACFNDKYSGKIRVNAININNFNDREKEMWRSKVAVVDSSIELPDSYTIIDLLLISIEHYYISLDKKLLNINSTLKQLKLDKLAHKTIDTLNQSQLYLLNLALAVIRMPQILMLLSPFSILNKSDIKLALTLIKKLHKKHKNIVLFGTNDDRDEHIIKQIFALSVVDLS